MRRNSRTWLPSRCRASRPNSEQGDPRGDRTMKQILRWIPLLALGCFLTVSDSHGRGFGARGAGGGYRAAGGVRTGAAVGPYGGAGVGTRTGSTVVGPAGGAAHRGTASGSYTTGRGTTIDYAGAGRGVSGPGGAAAGRGVGGVQVTTPGGQTITRAGTAGGAVGPGGGGVAGHRSVGGTTGPRGTAVGGSAGRTGIGAAGAVHGGYRGGVAAGPYGAAAVGTRAVVGTRGVSGVRYGTYPVRTTALRTQGTYLRQNFTYYRAFSPTWYRQFPGAWAAAGWVAGRAWTAASWGAVSSYCSYPTEPVYYDYGTSIVYEGEAVYVNGEQTATAEQYATQATQIAQVGQDAKPPEDEQWQPLGVYALVRGEEQNSDKILQLAVSKDGILRGN